MLRKILQKQNYDSSNSRMRLLGLFACVMLFGISLQAQPTIECRFPNVPTDCSPCIDPSPLHVNVDTDCPAGYQLTIGDPVYTGGGAPNCPGATYTVTYTATDNCEGSDPASCTQTWVIENSGPVLNVPQDLYLNCGDPINESYIEYWLSTANASSDCPLTLGGVTNSYSSLAGNSACNSGTATIIFFTVFDQCGRSATGMANIFIFDYDLPIVVSPAEDNLVVCGGETLWDFQEWLNNHGGAVIEDACDSNLSWSTIPANPTVPLACDEVEVTFVATDDCGNSASSTATFSLIDCHPPQLNMQAMSMTVECSDNSQAEFEAWLSNNGGAVAVDACGSVTWMTDPMNPELSDDCGNTGSVTVTFIAKDDCGNEKATMPATFTVEDTTPPVVPADVPANVTVQCADQVPAPVDLTANDACEGPITVSPSAVITPGDCDNQFTMVRTWTFVDDCGNTSSVSQTISVDDTMAPVVPADVPANVTVQCADQVPAPVDLTANDNCDGDITASPSAVITPGDCDDQFTMVRTWTFTDNCGNSSSVSQTITVFDDTAPVITGVGDDDSIECSNEVEFSTPEATDNCSNATLTSNDVTLVAVEGGLSGDQEVPANDSPGSGTVSGTYNQESGKMTINVSFEGLMDSTLFAHIHNAPEGSNGGVVFTLPIEADVFEGEFMFMATLDADQQAEFEDGNYYINIHTQAVPSGELRAQLFVKSWIGNTTRTWTATDACGNTSTATQTISFSDTDAPVPSYTPEDMTISCGDPVEFSEAPTWTDNCDTDIFTSVEDLEEDANCPYVAIYVRAWSAIDDCGNLATVKQRIFVIDNTPPVFTYVPPVPDIDCMVPPFEFGVPVAEDDCGGEVTLTFVDEEPNGSICDEGAAYVRAYTATDECGNSSTVDVVVWVNPDEGAPVFTFVPEDLTFYCSDGEPAIPDAIAEDDCDPDVTITFEDEFNTDPDDCGNGYGYDIIRTWTATDHCGNETTAVTLAWVKGPFSSPNAFTTNSEVGQQAQTSRGFGMVIQPNPVGETLNVRYLTDADQRANIRVFNILGKEVYKQIENAAKGTNTSSINVQAFVPGTYLISIQIGDEIQTEKFIKR